MAITEMPDEELEPTDLEPTGFEEPEIEEAEEVEPEVEVPEPEPPKPEEEEYGKKVQKRIDKLTAKFKSAQERAEAAERKAKELEERFGKFETGYQEREREAEKRSFDSQMSDIKARMEAAVEDADLAQYHKLNEQLMELRIQQTQAKPETKPEPAKEHPPVNEIPPAAQSWLDQNRSWLSDRKNRIAIAAAREIEQDLLDQGYDQDEELYEELDRRLEEEYPRIREIRSGKQERTPSVAGGGRSVPAKERPQPGKITSDDVRAMRRYGFDPDSAADRKAWLNRNKI